MDEKEFRRIIQFAMENEVSARNFYRDAADKLDDTGLKDIFVRLADEEQDHFDILQNLYNKDSLAGVFDPAKDYGVAETIEEPALSTDMKPADAFALAMKKEADAMDMYTRLASICHDAAEKNLFLELAEMERGHKQKMENAFVDIGYPETW